MTHSFKNILEFNIVSDIEEWGIDYFITKHLGTIEAMKQIFWPLDFNNAQQLKEYLVKNNYKFIRISCSYGLQGWILPKESEIY